MNRQRRTRKQVKKLILDFLKGNNRVPTSKIAVMLNYDFNNCKKILEELEKEDLIIREEETNSIYWKIKEH